MCSLTADDAGRKQQERHIINVQMMVFHSTTLTGVLLMLMRIPMNMYKIMDFGALVTKKIMLVMKPLRKGQGVS